MAGICGHGSLCGHRCADLGLQKARCDHPLLLAPEEKTGSLLEEADWGSR